MSYATEWSSPLSDEYYIVRRGGRHSYESFLNNPDVDIWATDKDFGSQRNAYRFNNPNEAHQIVRENEGDFQGSVIRTDGKDLYELVYDKR